MYEQSSSAEPRWPEHFQPDVVRHAFRHAGKLSSYCLALEAWRRGLDVTLFAPNATALEVTDGETTRRFDRSRSDLITNQAQRIVDNKRETTDWLRAHNVPVPDSQVFDSASDFGSVLKTAQRFGFPVVLKPVRGSRGRGVLSHIENSEDLQAAYSHLRDEFDRKPLLLERHHFGHDYRVYVVGDQYIAACKRIPANVIGDGTSTVAELIEIKNSKRRLNPFLSGATIKVDYEVKNKIYAAGYTLGSILPSGEHLPLRSKANASAGGDVEDVTDALPARIRQAAIAAVQAVPGLPAAGVDILWDSNPATAESNDFVVIEMNSRAHIGVNMYPTSGRGQDVPKAIIDSYFPRNPRPSGQHFANLIFDLKSINDLLSNGTAQSVTLYPPAEHGFPIRRIYTLNTTKFISRRFVNQIYRMARKFSIVCDVTTSNGSSWMTLGAGDTASLNDFLASFTHISGEVPQQSSSTAGPLQASSRVPQS
ncbi:ATP-grasp domain-containing protein [Nesterenkonia natronophila]|uniref:ATP-grasp domain-containing protein n=1 Tax=Nesterenkonia natronophila TaxID=2174932 RepID=A0A3A4F3N4_9MICC|nr:ATP-grasp domain-containing protein [Nesterenkonia natronophila]RJN31070.1 ATP-grasp domain-containing protein [Nesterenkonia natronophila]